MAEDIVDPDEQQIWNLLNIDHLNKVSLVELNTRGGRR